MCESWLNCRVTAVAKCHDNLGKQKQKNGLKLFLMETLNASLLNVVLKIREGSGFGFLSSPFVIVCNLNGNILTSDPIPCSPNPTFESDFVWEAEKKFLRSMRSNNYSVRVEFFSDAKYKRHDKIGYILLNMKQQTQIVSSKLGKNVTYNWHKLLGVRNDAKSYKPEIFLSLFIKEADFELESKTPKTPPASEPVAVKLTDTPSMEAVQDAVVPSERFVPRSTIQVGSPRDTDIQFKLQVRITSSYNLAALLPAADMVNDDRDLRIEFALFGECYKSGDLLAHKGEIQDECITLQIKAQAQALTAYFSEFPSLYFLLQASGHTISKAPFDIQSLITLEKCEALINGKVSILKKESKLYPDNQTQDSNCHFSVIVTLECEKGKINNAVKPFTVSSIKQNTQSQVAKNTGNKLQIKGVHCKTKSSISDIDKNVMPSESDGPQFTSYVPSIDSESNNIKCMDNNGTNEVAAPKANFFQPVNQPADIAAFQNNLNCNKNFNELKDFNQTSTNSTQFIYPYFQQPFPYTQDGRGDSNNILLPSQTSLADSVKAKITDELAKKTYDELEEWKDKQKETYKQDLKKKLDREVKRLTAEWLSRQNELEREAASNIEESVMLSQQLHCTSSELKTRLEAVNKQQTELETEREGLEKKYAEKQQEFKESTKKQQANMQNQITSLKGEVEELRTKICCLTKENEMLRLGTAVDSHVDIQLGMGKQVSAKSTHLTEQQMTSLLVDMKSLEEKLSAAIESKEFFRKEWSRALREIHRMKTEQEEHVRQQLQAQRQELDNLRLVGLIAADDKSSKDDLASIRDLRNQIVRLNTPKTS